jgi:hypothetical protein
MTPDQPMHGTPDTLHISTGEPVFLATIDDMDIWWDPDDVCGMPYLINPFGQHRGDWVGIHYQYPGNPAVAPAMDFIRNHHSLR